MLPVIFMIYAYGGDSCVFPEKQGGGGKITTSFLSKNQHR